MPGGGERERPGRPPLRARWRRLALGMATLLGRPRGFFSPYRHAGSLCPPDAYPAMEAALAAAFAAAPTGGLSTPADVLAAISRHAAMLRGFDGPAPEPRWTQSWYPRLDGAAAYAIVREGRPRRIVEVGSGHSTRFLARAARDAGAATAITCIDPEPRAALGGLGVDWRAEVLSPAHLPLFEALGPGDVAFFDSSHLLWPGSDVDIVLNRILPALARGVLVHVHDVFLPDPYPPDWAWRGYTEQLALPGWVLGGAYRPLWSSRWAATRAGAATLPPVAALPLPVGAVETAFWMRRA